MIRFSLVVLMFALPILVGILLAVVQLVWYRARLRAGRITADDVPMFPILLLRGMLVGLLVGVGFGVVTTAASGVPGIPGVAGMPDGRSATSPAASATSVHPAPLHTGPQAE